MKAAPLGWLTVKRFHQCEGTHRNVAWVDLEWDSQWRISLQIWRMRLSDISKACKMTKNLLAYTAQPGTKTLDNTKDVHTSCGSRTDLPIGPGVPGRPVFPINPRGPGGPGRPGCPEPPIGPCWPLCPVSPVDPFWQKQHLSVYDIQNTMRLTRRGECVQLNIPLLSAPAAQWSPVDQKHIYHHSNCQ